MGRKHRLVQHGSHRTVQRFNGSVEHKVLPDPLSQVAQDILMILGSGGVAGNAVAAAGVVKSDVSYWAQRFVDAGALVVRESQDAKTLGRSRKEQRIGPGIPKYYDLTPYGSKILTGSEGDDGRLPVVFEDNPVKFSVLKWERFGSIDWKKLGDVRNWVKFGFRVSGVRVIKTSRNVIVHPGPLMGFNVDQLQVDSGRIVERVRYILEIKFGMQLSEDCEFLHGPMWQVFRPEARAWIKQGGSVKVPGVGVLDASKKPWLKELSGVGHVEFCDKRDAALASVWPPVSSDPDKQNAFDALRYPAHLREIHSMVSGLVNQVDSLTVEVSRVKMFEDQVSGVMVEFKRLSEALSKLDNLDKLPEISVSLERVAELLNRLFDVEGSGQPSASKKLGEGYVR